MFVLSYCYNVFSAFSTAATSHCTNYKNFPGMKVFVEFSGFSMKKSNPLVVALSQHITDKCVITGSNTPGINVRATALINGKNS